MRMHVACARSRLLALFWSATKKCCESHSQGVHGVNKGVNVCCYANCTTKPDPSHNPHVPPTQPCKHGKCTGGLHTCPQSCAYTTSFHSYLHASGWVGTAEAHVHSCHASTPSS